MERDIGVHTFHIKLCHKCSFTISHDPADDIIYFHVLQRERLFRNAVIEAMPQWLDKSKISRHFPGWYFFGITPKRLT